MLPLTCLLDCQLIFTCIALKQRGKYYCLCIHGHQRFSDTSTVHYNVMSAFDSTAAVAFHANLGLLQQDLEMPM